MKALIALMICCDISKRKRGKMIIKERLLRQLIRESLFGREEEDAPPRYASEEEIARMRRLYAYMNHVQPDAIFVALSEIFYTLPGPFNLNIKKIRDYEYLRETIVTYRGPGEKIKKDIIQKIGEKVKLDPDRISHQYFDGVLKLACKVFLNIIKDLPADADLEMMSSAVKERAAVEIKKVSQSGIGELPPMEPPAGY
jgi:hypothetical protein